MSKIEKLLDKFLREAEREGITLMVTGIDGDKDALYSASNTKDTISNLELVGITNATLVHILKAHGHEEEDSISLIGQITTEAIEMLKDFTSEDQPQDTELN